MHGVLMNMLSISEHPFGTESHLHPPCSAWLTVAAGLVHGTRQISARRHTLEQGCTCADRGLLPTLQALEQLVAVLSMLSRLTGLVLNRARITALPLDPACAGRLKVLCLSQRHQCQHLVTLLCGFLRNLCGCNRCPVRKELHACESRH